MISSQSKARQLPISVFRAAMADQDIDLIRESQNASDPGQVFSSTYQHCPLYAGENAYRPS